MCRSEPTGGEIRRLLVIPARGGSKRIQKKNLSIICGNPIIYFPIAAAVKSKLFDLILVSSDNDEILNYAKSISGVSINRRPQELSDDHATVYSVLRYEVERLRASEKVFSEVWLLAATACLIDELDLIQVATTVNSESLAILGVTEYQVPIQWAMKINESGSLTAINFESTLQRSQDVEKYFHDSGCLAVFKSEIFEEFDSFVPMEFFKPFILEHNKGLDIDNPGDLELAEALLKLKREKLA